MIKKLAKLPFLSNKQRTGKAFAKPVITENAKKMTFKPFIIFFVLVLCLATLVATFRGRPGTEGRLLSYQTQDDWVTIVTGPFESSNTNSRYALVDAIVNKGTFNLTLKQAGFAVPDAVYVNERFASIFMPGVSLIAAPFYYVGQKVGLAQVFTFGSTIVFAIVNAVLLYAIGKKLSMNTFSALLGSAVFLFATNALAYTNTLTQHHASTATILSALYLASSKPTVVRNFLFGMILGASLLFDIPNVFLLLPITLAIVGQHFSSTQENARTVVSVNIKIIAIAIGCLPLLALFFTYNQLTFGSPFTYGQMFSRTDYFDDQAKKDARRERHENVDAYEDKLPLGTRQQLQSTYILLLSDERSWLFYSPIVLVGILGLIAALTQDKNIFVKNAAILCSGTVLMNIVVYSMFGDPWGGWSFGPRYLIPSAAVLSLLAAYAFETWNSKKLFAITFLVIALYSSTISTLGAVTTLSIPPKVEADQLINRIPHTYQYNINLLKEGKNSSLLFNAWAHYFVTPYQFWILLSCISGSSILLLAVSSMVERKAT